MRSISVVLAVLLSANLLFAEGTTSVIDPEEVKEGFISLFDGQTLKGWTGDLKGCHIENGTLVSERGNQYTEKEYANFVLRFEFKLPTGGNNGVGIRTPMKGVPAYVGMEVQIQDDGDPSNKDDQPWQSNGSIYGVAAAKHGFLKPIGEWNDEEISADGSRIKVTLNGTVILDADIGKIDKTIDGHDHPGLHNAEGHIAWLGHTGAVAFRNIRIKTLP